MRLWRRVSRPFVASTVLVALALAGAGTARADVYVYGPKVDDALASQVEKASLETKVDVIAFGPDLLGANLRLNLNATHMIDAIGAESVTLQVKDISRLAADPGVTFLTTDLPAAPTGKQVSTVTPTASTLATRYPVIDGATDLWSRGIDGTGVGIAVIDSGTVTSPDFGDRLSKTVLSTQNNGAVKDDSIGHGSMVASIAAGRSLDGRFVGIAPGASVYSINVAAPGGIRTGDILVGLDWVLKKNLTKKNIRVVVLSLSEITATSYNASALDAMIDKLWRSGVVVVVSAGNTGPGTAQFAPANDPLAISVGAVDDAGTLNTGDDFQTAWTTSGLTQDGFAKPDVLAPGRRVPGILPLDSELGLVAPLENKLGGGYGTMSGTSFSAPQVAGAVALVWQAHKTWTPDMIKWVLMNTARPVPGGSAGGLDIKAAVDYSGEIGLANQGVPPSAYASSSWTAEQFKAATSGNSWNGNSWNGNSWNGNSWNGNSWNGNSWN